MLILKKDIVFPVFRRERLLEQLKIFCSSIEDCELQQYFLVDAADMGADASARLAKILAAEPVKELRKNTYSCWVVPRFGTISPWCSKATDILQQCGLTQVRRVERVLAYTLASQRNLSSDDWLQLMPVLHDRMTQSLCFDPAELSQVFQQGEAQADVPIPVLSQGIAALQTANETLGLALSAEEIEYLALSFVQLKRDPTAAELMMFAQANSEHCRHKVFNASWMIDGEAQPHSLFAMIKQSYQQAPQGVLSAYKDNAAVLKGHTAQHYFADDNHQYQFSQEVVHTVLKVETHNHPTGISPAPGAATGVGGEIRDEAATGRGAKTIAGLTGFCVSDLCVPDFQQAWEETKLSKPSHMASALEIMLQAPIGGAAFANEFGRPNLCGYFRTLYHEQTAAYARGYHKPIMITGGMGHIRESLVQKQSSPAQALVIVLGGPAMLIGLGGGAASSMKAQSGKEHLDYASVQRGNPEMQRRAQEVINGCWALGDKNPILAIHDVGAGGIANAIPEILHDSERGGQLQLRAVPNEQKQMTPMAIWCNESQERYVLTIKPKDLVGLQQIATRERCPLAVLGEVTQEEHLTLLDEHFNNKAVDVAMSWLFGHLPKMQRNTQHVKTKLVALDRRAILFTEALERVLQLPAVASKSFLITIGDRSITGLVARDQMVGPWQVPVADVAVTTMDYSGYQGTALALGERPTVALIDARASVALALGEAITNIVAAGITKLSDVCCSANWMAAVNEVGEDTALYDAVQYLSNLCQRLNICIPVGKDSLSMQTTWQEKNVMKQVVAPLTLNLTASAPIADVRRVLTPQLQAIDSQLIFIDLACGQQRLGGSALAQVYKQIGQQCPTLEDTALLLSFVKALGECLEKSLLLAYHDRSDGGLWATVCEMSFAGHVGVHLDISQLGDDPLAILANEELGVVIQVAPEQLALVRGILENNGLAAHVYDLGNISQDDRIIVQHQGAVLLNNTRVYYQKLWAETSYQLQKLRDNPHCAQQEYEALDNVTDPGLHAYLSFDYPLIAPRVDNEVKPRVAILREQGINGHVEMAAAFSLAGFDCIDVTMQDLLMGDMDLNSFVGLVACGGFSYGDVLGAGKGWANTILYHEAVQQQFKQFWQRSDTFTLGVCNGCQMLAHLKAIIPGCHHWPDFVNNESEQFEARFTMVEILDSPSILFKGMAGTRLPITVAHGEGRVSWPNESLQTTHTVMRYVNNDGKPTQQYPANPNGSPHGQTGFCSEDGRVTILMPHPERVFRSVQCSWYPKTWQAYSPWMQLFYNAREWVKV